MRLLFIAIPSQRRRVDDATMPRFGASLVQVVRGNELAREQPDGYVTGAMKVGIKTYVDVLGRFYKNFGRTPIVLAKGDTLPDTAKGGDMDMDAIRTILEASDRRAKQVKDGYETFTTLRFHPMVQIATVEAKTTSDPADPSLLPQFKHQAASLFDLTQDLKPYIQEHDEAQRTRPSGILISEKPAESNVPPPAWFEHKGMATAITRYVNAFEQLFFNSPLHRLLTGLPGQSGIVQRIVEPKTLMAGPTDHKTLNAIKPQYEALRRKFKLADLQGKTPDDQVKLMHGRIDHHPQTMTDLAWQLHKLFILIAPLAEQN